MRILLVEDDANLAPFLVRALEEASFVVDRAPNLAEARRLLAASTYDLLSLDVQLPDGSGLDFLAEVRGTGLATPAIVLSSLGEVDDRVRGLDRGADDYLPKPFALEEYLSRVRSLLRRGSARRPVKR